PKPRLRHLDPPPPVAVPAHVRGFHGAASLRNARVDFAARRRPFLYAREMIVIAIFRAPHRMYERTVGRRFILKAGDDGGELFARAFGLAVGSAILEADLVFAARGIAAVQPDVNELRYRRPDRNPFKPSTAQDRGFQRELRGKTAAHLRLRR